MKRKIAMATLALIPLTATNAFASNQEGIVTATSLNVRSGPSTGHSVIFTVKKNDKVTILQSDNGWYKISAANGKSGWVSSEYISTNISNTNQSTNKKIVNADTLNMRSGASTSYRVIAKLSKGNIVELISENNGWSKVKYDGRLGYVSSEFLSNIDGDIPDKKPEKPSETLPDTIITKIKVVTATSLNVRSGPSTSNALIGSLRNNEKVEVISESNGWSKIKYGGRVGYVSSIYLKDVGDSNTNTNPNPSEKPNGGTTKTKVVTATSLNVRSGPSTSHGLIGTLKHNEKVEVISESNGWSKIKYNGKEAYVSSDYLKDAGNSNTNTNPNPSEKPNEGTTKTKVVTATSLNVRSGPSTSHGLIGTLKHNEKVEVISESNGWSKIKYNGKEAYVSSTYLKDAGDSNTNTNPNPSEKPNEGTTKTKVVTATSLNVRSGPSTSHGLIGTLKHSEKVEVISESNGWSKIKYNGKEAYVSSTYLKDYDGDISSGGDSSEVVNGATVNYKYENHSLQDHINKQLSKVNMIASSSGGFINASRSDIEHYLNPNNFKNGKKGMLQFLRLDSYKGGITAGELNGYLNSLKPASSGTNVFYNQGQAFINAARKYNIDLSYLVGHSMLETGYGRSTLAQGQVLTSYKGKPLPQPVKVYNFFGIGAFDGTANLSGAEAAYKNGWTSVEKTIEGSARWISSNYIHHGSYGQNTLYKMRWSYDHLHHQYATDVNWANAISGIMYKFIGMYDTNSNLIFEIPVHR
ncbi:SH3 domain-containing protein [[Eubacterium] tenue]|nr:SH3 domain-containing protein [[Eubacterium] tenue]MBC8632182.1 SH3 domain-containing protein [[Eubacterium] tenue]